MRTLPKSASRWAPKTAYLHHEGRARSLQGHPHLGPEGYDGGIAPEPLRWLSWCRDFRSSRLAWRPQGMSLLRHPCLAQGNQFPHLEGNHKKVGVPEVISCTPINVPQISQIYTDLVLSLKYIVLFAPYQNVTLMIFPRLSSLALCNFSQSIDGFKISLLYWS